MSSMVIVNQRGCFLDLSLDAAKQQQVERAQVLKASEGSRVRRFEGLYVAQLVPRVLISEKQMARDKAPLKNLKITLAGIPQTGLPKTLMWGASSATFLLIVFAIVLGAQAGSRRKKSAELKSYRDVLLADIEELERARLAGDIGPKTYERARRELTDELARTFSAAEGKKTPAGAPAAATA